MEQIESCSTEQLLTFAAQVNKKVAAVLRTDLEEALAGCDPLLIEILNYAVFGGGKRVRPLLTVLAGRICGRDDEGLYLLAGAFEYLHVASLIHDDIIDNAPQRRGRESLSARYGSSAAILAGDWLLSRSMRLIGKLAGQEGLAAFCRTTEGMVDGEFLQLRHVANPEVGEEEYFAVIRRKTGNLIASTCETGAIYAGAEPTAQKALAEFGDKTGAAFQVIDDLLDYLGDAKKTGKATGNDFIEGKITLPLIRALAKAEPHDRAAVTQLITGDRTDPAAYDRVYDFITRHDGFDSSAATAKQLVHEAVHALSCFTATGKMDLALLHALARYILERKK